MTSTSEFVELFRNKTPADFDAWVVKAQPRAQMLYGVGFCAVQAAPAGVALRMRMLADAGLVITTTQRQPKRAGGQLQYLAIRTARPVPAGFPRLPVPRDIVLAARAAGKGLGAYLEGAR